MTKSEISTASSAILPFTSGLTETFSAGLISPATVTEKLMSLASISEVVLRSLNFFVLVALRRPELDGEPVDVRACYCSYQ